MRLSILLFGLACGLGYQVYKLQVKADTFWNVRLPIVMVLGILFFFGLTYINGKLLGLFLGRYDIRVQLRDMAGYLPFFLLFLFPLQQAYFQPRAAEFSFTYLLGICVALAILIKAVIINHARKEATNTTQGEAHSPVGAGRLCIAAVAFGVPLFWLHQLSFSLSEFYAFSGTPMAALVRDNEVTRKTIASHGKISLPAKIPFQNSSVIVGYKVFRPPGVGVEKAMPVSLRLRVVDDKGSVIARRRWTLEGGDLQFQGWRNIQIDLSVCEQNTPISFLLNTRPAILEAEWSQLLDFLFHPPADSEYFRNLIAWVGWSEPEFISSGPKRPNVIVISADTLRADSLGCYGYGKNVSPSIDSFASENVRFENAFSQSTWTLPSHLSILTGKFPGAFGEYLMKYIPDVAFFDKVPSADVGLIPAVTLPEVLRENGYYCAAFTDGVFLSTYYGFSRGFHTYNERYGPDGNSLRLAKEWIDENLGKDFFVFIHTYLIHDYWMGDQLTMEGGREKDVNGLLSSVKSLFPDEDPRIFLSSANNQRKRDWYDVRIRLFDSHLGEFLSFLKERDLYDDSLIVLLSDHGEAFNEVHSDGKITVNMHGGAPYESLIRVPLVMKLPAGTLEHPLVIRNDAQLLDVGPTIVRRLGLKTDSQFQGHPLLPGFEPEEERLYPFVHATWRGPGGCVRRGQRKYIYLGEDAGEEFYDLEYDPREMRNLSHLEPREMIELRKQYNDFVAEVGESKIGVKVPPGAPAELRETLKALGYID